MVKVLVGIPVQLSLELGFDSSWGTTERYIHRQDREQAGVVYQAESVYIQLMALMRK